MKSALLRLIVQIASHVIPDSVARWMMKRMTAMFRSKAAGQPTDDFLELLLGAMDISFCLSTRFRRNIKGFKGRYVFRTADGAVVASAEFRGSDMVVHEDAIDDPDVTVTFKSVAALWRFLLQGRDVVNAVIADEVEISGNLNYVYRFGFLAADLTRRLGIA